MPDQEPQRETQIKEWAKRLQVKIDGVLPKKPNEAEFRKVVDRELDDFCAEIGSPVTHAEYTLATGKADATFNRLIVEYEKPGVLKRTWDKATAHAVDQVKDYIKGVAEKEGRELERLAGVAFDGYYLIFVRQINGKWAMEPPMECNQHTLERLFLWLSGLTSGIALTAENLNKDFSLEQDRTKTILDALYTALQDALSKSGADGMVSKLFAQWKLFFSESIEYSEAFGGRKLDPLKKWAAKAGIEITTAQDAEHFFFALHTYFALLVKFLAWLALSKHFAVKLGKPSFSILSTLEGEALKAELKKMEEGGIFHAYGIMNLLEGDFFEWYLYAWNDKIEDAARELLKRLDQYDPTTLSEIPEETRDLFKKLYHYLLPRAVRHNLGEYYTPDWLAQRLLNQVDNQFFNAEATDTNAELRRKLLGTRWLDPACGSGTFLVLIISRILAAGKRMMINETELLEGILSNVQGIDLNPLAVLTARVNYLLALGDMVENRKDVINIPVYLADSVRGPELGKDLETAATYKFPTAIGPFYVPIILCDPAHFDRFCDILEESVNAEVMTASFMKRVEKELNITPSAWDTRAVLKLRELYEQLLDFHSKGMNGLWARLLKNNFAPLAMGQFDNVVGNPPWVNWESLPDEYRKSIKPIWERYGLFPHGGMDTILGKGKKDISMLMTYVVIDKLLKQDGKLGFVITQSVFKTSGAAQGFRRFSIPDGKSEIPLRVVYVDDMVSLNPFEGATNRTAVVVIQKGKRTNYPVSYTLWRKIRGERFSYDNTLEEVQKATKRLELYAEPVSDEDCTSAWLTARKTALKAVRKILGKSNYRGYEGVNTGGANGVYWVDVVDTRPDGLLVVKNITEGAKTKVKEVTEAVEPDLLYPLLRGRDIKRWKSAPSAHILMVQDPIKRRGIDEEKMQDKYVLTRTYLKKFEKILRDRAAFKRYFTREVKDSKTKKKKVIETGSFYSMFNVGEYTFAPWKVVWREQASCMTASVVGSLKEKVIIPDHKLMLVETESKEEAHYLCALLNCSFVRMGVLSYAVSIQMDTHILENIRIPKFDPKDKTHKRLAELSEQAHKAASKDDQKALIKTEGDIDAEAATLWGLDDKELAEIQKALKELGSTQEPEEKEEN